MLHRLPDTYVARLWAGRRGEAPRRDIKRIGNQRNAGLLFLRFWNQGVFK